MKNNPNNILKKIQEETIKNTEAALKYMASYNIVPEGKIELFRSPDTRQRTIDIIPYTHKLKQLVSYTTEPGEFSAQCPFSGLPDYGTVKITYVPEKCYLELKSLKYYFMSFRNIGASQEDITAYIFSDISKSLKNPKNLTVESIYNVRGGINTECRISSKDQK